MTQSQDSSADQSKTELDSKIKPLKPIRVLKPLPPYLMKMLRESKVKIDKLNAESDQALQRIAQLQQGAKE